MRDNKYEEALSKAVKRACESNFDTMDFYKDIKYVEYDLINYAIKKKHSNDALSASKFSADGNIIQEIKDP